MLLDVNIMEFVLNLNNIELSDILLSVIVSQLLLNINVMEY